MSTIIAPAPIENAPQTISTTGANPQPTAEKTFTAAELASAIEAARKEEKDKLYAELTTLRTQVSALNGEKETLSKSLDTLTAEHSTLKSSADIITKSKGKTGEIDVQKLVEEVTERAAKQAAETYGSQVTALNTQLTALQGEIKQKQLGETRTRLIAEAGGEAALIPELVKGNNEEELRASLAESKRIFDSAKARFTPSTATPPAGSSNVQPPADANSQVPPITAPPMPPAQPSAAPSAPLLQHIPTGRADPKNWASERRSKLDSLAGRYPSR